MAASFRFPKEDSLGVSGELSSSARIATRLTSPQATPIIPDREFL